MSSPTLSIVMPVYNAAAYIREAVASILNQTFTDFELIIINDGSTDDSMEVLNGFKDSRISILDNEKNSGIVFSRNKGIDAAKGKFIAPFDSDDIALPEKFEKQISFLHKNPDFGMIGSWAWLIDKHGKKLKEKWKVNAPAERIPAILLFRNYFVQSSMVIRSEVIPSGKYSKGFDVVEDYKMWFDITRNHKSWNFPDYLVKYRIHKKGASQSDQHQYDLRDMMMFDYIYGILGITLNPVQKKLLVNLKKGKPFESPDHLRLLEQFMIQIIETNKQLRTYNFQELIKAIYNRFLKACFLSRHHGVGTLRILATSELTILYLRRFLK
jgi:glycosyltransferase involved in cell wall biosynthesis